MKQTVSKIVKQTTTEVNKTEERGQAGAWPYPKESTASRTKDTYSVESESSYSRYYFVRYNSSVLEFCNCMDYGSNRSERCKHIFAIKHSIRMGTLKEVDKLPAEVHSNIKKQSAEPKSYLDDEYSF